MARPARRRIPSPRAVGSNAALLLFAASLGIAVAVGFVRGMLRLAESQPVVFAILVAAAGGGAYLAVMKGRARAARGRAWQAQQAQIAYARSTEIARYHAMAPAEFEHAVAYLCQRDGCTSVAVSGGAGDLGADVQATAPDGRRIVIQCKRYGPANKVGSPDMQRFGGTCFSVHGAQVAALVTTSVFTRQAADYAVRHGIRLVDVDGLAGWASRTGPAPWH